MKLIIPLIDPNMKELSVVILEIIALLCNHNTKSQQLFKEYKGISITTKVFKNCPHSEIQASASKVIKACVEHNNRMQIEWGKSGVISPMSGLLNSVGNKPLLLPLLQAIFWLVYEYDSNAKDLVSAKALPHLVRLLSSPHSKVVCLALEAIRSSTRAYPGKVQSSMKDLEAVSIVCQHLNPVNKPRIKTAAAGALFELCRENSKLQDAAVNSGGVPFIVAGLAAPSYNSQYYCEGIIWMCCKGNKSRKIAFVKGGAIEGVHPLRSSPNEEVRKGSMHSLDVLEKK